MVTNLYRNKDIFKNTVLRKEKKYYGISQVKPILIEK